MVYERYEGEGKCYFNPVVLTNISSQVTYGTLQAFYASAAFLLFWTFLQPKYYGLFFFLLIIPALLNLIKFFPYIFANVTIESLMPGNQLSSSSISRS